MSAEYIPFDISLIGKEEVVISCDSHEDYRQMLDVLHAVGVKWYGGDSLNSREGWDEKYNCRRIDTNKRMTMGHRELYENEYSDRIFMTYAQTISSLVAVEDLL